MFATDEALIPPRLGILARVLAVAWCTVVALSFALTNIGVDGVDTAAELYAPLSLVPMLLIGVLAVRTYGIATRFGRAALCVMGGAVLWDLGDLYYTIENSCERWGLLGCDTVKEPAYASLADAGYLLALVVWGLACVQLWRAVGIGRRDIIAFWWVPASTFTLMALLASPTFVHIGPVPIGFDIADLSADRTAGSVMAIAYFVADAILLAAAIVLWRRSYGFRPYRLAVRASATLFVADVVYEARVAAGAYSPQADIADAFYALSIAFLMFALLAFERAGRAERVQREAALAYAREHFARQPVAPGAGGSTT